MQLPSSVDVLVVGAGPTGLAVAVSAILAGCGTIMVVDALDRGQNTSRATIVHSQTLEVMERIGVASALIQAGNKSTRGVFCADECTLLEVPFNKCHEKYGFMLMIPQSETERILTERLHELGGEVHYKQKIVALQDVEKEMKSVVFEDGRVVKAKYVVGADGLHSVIREQAGISYTDPTPGRPEDFHVGQMCLADVRFTTPLPPSKQHFTANLTSQGFLAMIPLPDGSARVVAGMPRSVVVPQHPDLEYLRKTFKEKGLTLEVASVTGASRFRVRSRLAGQFYVAAKDGVGAVTLAGDAAHTHSPAGGQGMNLGLIDGVYLAQAIRAHMDTGNEEFLTTYSRERKARALQVIHGAERLSFLMEHLLTWRAFLVRWGMWLLGFFPQITLKIARMISGTDSAPSSF